MAEKSSTNSKVHVMQSSSSESSCNDVAGSFDPDLPASESDRPEHLQRHLEVRVVPPGTTPRETSQLELHLEVKVVPSGTIPRETGQLELHQEVKVVPPGTMPRETGGKVVYCTECVKKGYTGHRCCDDVPGISRGPHQQASL